MKLTITNIVCIRKFTILVFVFLMGSLLSFGSSIDIFTRCVITKDMNLVKNYFADNIQIAIDNQKNILTQDKAAILLETFLKKNKLINFTIDNQGKSNSTNQQFAIATLQTNIRTYKVFITVDKHDMISQIQFM